MRRIALITGVGRERGIGFEVARQLGASGWTVLLTARRAPDELASILRATGTDAHAVPLDVTREADFSRLAETLAARWPIVDALINNAAGTSPYGESAETVDLAAARAVLDVTFFGAWRTTQVVLPFLRQSAAPRIVNVTSGAGSHGDSVFGLTSANAMGPAYATAKAALNALTAVFARNARGTNLLVNAVCPGFTATFDGAEAMGARPVADGAAGIVWAATLPADGPNGGFFRDRQPLPW